MLIVLIIRWTIKAPKLVVVKLILKLGETMELFSRKDKQTNRSGYNNDKMVVIIICKTKWALNKAKWQ